MPRYFIRLAYDGSPFCGWQVQPGQSTVQGELEQALGQLLAKPVGVAGCGRTDTGVHANDYLAHIDVSDTVDTAQVTYKLNKMLHPAIGIREIFPVEGDFHARFSATARTYRYFIHAQSDPFVRDFSWHVPQELDVVTMNQAAERLLHYSDFSSFCRSGSETRTNECRVSYASWSAPEAGRLVFEITADRFLRNMVRAIVGTLIEVGRGKSSVQDFESIVEAKDRSVAGTSAKAHGLFLWSIAYPEAVYEHATTWQKA